MNPHRPTPRGLSRLLTCACLLVAPGLALRASTPPPVTPEKTYTLDTCVTVFDPAKLFKNGPGQAFWFADEHLTPDHRTVKLSIMPPRSASHPPHFHPEDEFFLVLEGTAEFFLNGQTRVVKAMASLYAPSNVPHGIRNVGDTELRYLVIKQQLPK